MSQPLHTARPVLSADSVCFFLKLILGRYCIERIVEFYGSTEGNVNMVNNTGKVGAVGVIPWFAERLYPILLLRVSSGELSSTSAFICVGRQLSIFAIFTYI